jgi:predicted transcriptional regulator
MALTNPISAHHLSKRERQVMDSLISVGEATVAELRAKMPLPPSYSAIRAVLRVLLEKGLVAHRYDGPRYVYTPTASRAQARLAALKHVLDLYFEGSREQLVAAILDEEATPKELKRLARLIDRERDRRR